MSNYTEADVEQWALEVHDGSNLRTHAVLTAIAKLKAAALEGAKVPGLEQQVADLQQKVCDWQAASGLESGSGDPDGIEPHHLEADIRKRDAEVSALQARVAELEAKVTQAHAEWDAATDRTTEVTTDRNALRAQVEELERERESLKESNSQLAKLAARGGAVLDERDALRATADRLVAREVEITGERDAAIEQRDALRAQVLKAEGAVYDTVFTIYGDSQRAQQVANALVAALSAPPAGTTTAPERDPRFQCAVHTNCFGDSEYCTKRETPAPERAGDAAPFGEVVTCPHCRKTVTTRVPTGGDGSLRLLRHHLCATGWRSDVESK